MVLTQHLKLLLKKIKKGKVTTYKYLAKAMKTQPRALARMLSSNAELILIPCHRVIKSDLTIGGYKLGVKKKIELLKSEGVIISGNKVSKTCIVKL